MIFAHDTEVALNAAAALVNTAHDGEALPTVAALDDFVDEWGWTGARAHDAQELAEVQALRPRLEALWSADKDEAAELVNGLLRESRALPQLVKHDKWDYHLHATSPDAPLAERMAVEAAMAVVDVIRMDELDRLQRLRGRGLRRRAGRPVEEPVAPVLRHDLREPHPRRGVPRPPLRLIG